MKKSPLRLQRGLLDRRICAARRVARPRRKGLYAPPGANEMKRAPAKTKFLWGKRRKQQKRPTGVRRFLQRDCKPGSVVGSHLSGTDIAARLKPPVWRLAEQAVAPKSVLLRIEFTGCPRHRGHRWALTPPFHLFPAGGGVVCFCCTCPAVARGRCYRLSCSVKPGLSSQGRPCAAARPAAALF